MPPRPAEDPDRLTTFLGETSGIGPSYIDEVNLTLWSGGFVGFLDDLARLVQVREPTEIRDALESLRQVAYLVRDTPELRELARRHAADVRKRKVVGGVLGPEWFVYALLAYALAKTLIPLLETETDITRVQRIQKRFGVGRGEATRLLRIFEELRTAKGGPFDSLRDKVGLAKRKGPPPGS